MITSFVDESPTKKSMTVEVPAEEVKRETDRTVRGLANRSGSPAFAPGRCRRRSSGSASPSRPREVIEHLVNETVLAALKERGLVPARASKVDDLKFEFEAPLSFKVDLEVRPPVAPKDYLGLKVPAGSTEPSAAEVDAVLERIREGHAAYEPIEGRPPPTATSPHRPQGDLPGGKRQGLRGAEDARRARRRADPARALRASQERLPGTTVSFQKDFPADAPDAEFAGKTVLYSVTLVALKCRTLPPLDEELAKTALTPREGEPPEGRAWRCCGRR